MQTVHYYAQTNRRRRHVSAAVFSGDIASSAVKVGLELIGSNNSQLHQSAHA